MGRPSNRVLVLSPSLEDGGVETHLRTVASGLRARGIEVDVCLPRESALSSLRADLAAVGVSIIPFSYKWRAPHGTRQVLVQIVRDFWVTVRVLSRAHDASIYAMLPHPELSPGMVLAAAMFGRRSVVVVHLVPSDLRVSGPRRLLYAVGRLGGQQWVCVSEQNAEVLTTALSWSLGSIRTIYNGVPVRPWPSTAERVEAGQRLRRLLGLEETARLVLSVGRLNRQKGHDLIVNGIPTVLAEVPETYWVWAGEGAEKDALLERARTLRVEHRLILLGRLESVTELLLASDVLVFPSRYEGFPLALLEAQMAGLPVIVSDVGALPVIVRAELDGAVVPGEDVEALACATVAALRAPGQTQKQAELAGRRVRTEFSSERMIDELLSLRPDGVGARVSPAGQRSAAFRPARLTRLAVAVAQHAPRLVPPLEKRLRSLVFRGRVDAQPNAKVPLELCTHIRREARLTVGAGARIERGAIDVVEGDAVVGPESIIRSSQRFHVFPGGRFRTGRHCVIETGARILVYGELVLGDDVYVGRDVVLVAHERVSIGSGTLLGERVSIHDENHGPSDARQDFRVAAVTVGERVWLGAGTVVLSGTSIGDRTTVAANAAVTRPLPAGVLAGGVPARLIKHIEISHDDVAGSAADASSEPGSQFTN